VEPEPGMDHMLVERARVGRLPCEIGVRLGQEREGKAIPGTDDDHVALERCSVNKDYAILFKVIDLRLDFRSMTQDGLDERSILQGKAVEGRVATPAVDLRSF